MSQPRIVTQDEWLVARTELLAAEKEFTRQRDALSAARRALPMVEVTKEYVFASPAGPKTLAELFGGHRQLIVYHFMFEPDWDEGCKRCSFLADGFDGSPAHLAARDTAFTAASRASLARIDLFKKRMGWSFPWVSAAGSDFNYDFHATFDRAAGSTEYNYLGEDQLRAEHGHWVRDGGDMPGLSVFRRDGDRVFHTYSTYERGLDLLIATYNFLDLTPLGRQESGGGMAWVRHHDAY
jgi:predicted dithiol-disulfide oxidoreductase (DUF899 family)